MLLDPAALPLKAQLLTTTLMLGFFGILRDAIPDEWADMLPRNFTATRFRRNSTTYACQRVTESAPSRLAETQVHLSMSVE